MGEITVGTSRLGSALLAMLQADDLVPGDEPSYQLCKTILAYHPLGLKMTEAPITIAQSQKRKLSLDAGSDGARQRLIDAFEKGWEELGADEHIKNVGKLARAFGVASLGVLTEGTPPDRPLEFPELWDKVIGVNVFDPLNTAGSLVLNQNPNDLDFQKVKSIAVAGKAYHRSRSVTLLNEKPLYIEYTNSAFGYVGRSVYQRALYMLKSYLQTLITDDMVSVKSGVLIAKQKQVSSAVDAVMGFLAGTKREMVKEAKTFNVISIDTEEDIESLNLQNIDGAFGQARKDIIDNIATAADMPAIILNQETFAEGFGEGVEDSKRVVQYINGIRVWLAPVYRLMDKLVAYRQWNPEFYKALQGEFPKEYGARTHKQAMFKWLNSWSALWPNLIEEPESELIQVDDVKFKAVIAAVEVLAPLLDPGNRAKLIMWVVDCFNERKSLFPHPLILDFEELETFLEENHEAGLEAMQGEPGEGQEPKAAPPFSARDSAEVRRRIADFSEAVARLPARKGDNEARRIRLLQAAMKEAS